MANSVAIKPEIIRWAVDRSGLSLGDFKAEVKAWIDGEKLPTFPKLEAFARQAMVPFGYLFLEEPPDESITMPDYRTLGDAGVKRPSPNLLATIRDMQRRQDWMREYLVDAGNGKLPFVGSAKLGDLIESVVESIRNVLGLADDWARVHKNWEDAQRHLIRAIEIAGVLVFVNGIVANNTRRKLDPEEFRGFVLSDPYAPLIFVNGSDSLSARMFTLVHELAHIWLGENALINMLDLEPGDAKIEKFCNAIAAEFLVPEVALRELWSRFAQVSNRWQRLAAHFRVSRMVVARRAKDLNLISREEFFAYYRQQIQEEQRKNDQREGGGNFYLSQTMRLGRRFSRAVIAATKAGQLSYQDAYHLTHLHGDTFEKFAAFLNKRDNE